jgi:hypothetical protein
MKRSPKTRISIAAFTLLILGSIGYLWWAGLPPKRPSDMPANAVWVEPPPAPFDSPRGYWLGCWEDQATRCRLTDLKGTTLFEDIFRPYGNAAKTVSETDLRLKKLYTTEVLLFLDGEEVPVVHLEDGTVLIPASKYQAVKERLDKRG